MKMFICGEWNNEIRGGKKMKKLFVFGIVLILILTSMPVLSAIEFFQKEDWIPDGRH